MFLIKSKKKEVEKEVYNTIVEKYFEYVREYNDTLGAYDMSELLRYSLCKYLGLESKGSKQNIELESDRCINFLRGTLDSLGLIDKSKEYKSGILEACVHCIELSRKKAGI